MTHIIERVRIDETPVPVPSLPRRSRRALLAWAAILVGLGTAATLLLLAITSGTTAPRSEPTSVVQPPSGVPRSADGAERFLAGERAGVPPGVPGSADGAERFLAGDRTGAPQGVPGSADGAERFLAGDSR